MTRVIDWLMGVDDLTMPPEWMATRLSEHDRWTRSQQQPGMALIVSDTQTMARRHFWSRQLAKRQAGPKVAQFGRRQ